MRIRFCEISLDFPKTFSHSAMHSHSQKDCTYRLIFLKYTPSRLETISTLLQ